MTSMTSDSMHLEITWYGITVASLCGLQDFRMYNILNRFVPRSIENENIYHAGHKNNQLK